MRFGRLEPFLGTLRFRVTFWNTIGILILVLATFVGLHLGLKSSLQREMDWLLRADLDEIRLIVARFDRDQKMIREELDRKAFSHKTRSWFVRIYKSDGTQLFATTGAPPMLALVEAPGDALFSAEGFRVLEGSLDRRGETLRVRVGCSLQFVSDDVDALSRLLLFASLGIVVLAPLTGYWLARRATRPLATIVQTASRIRPCHFHERVPVTGSGDELDQLATTLNGLLDRVASHLERQRAFVANAAHELRSPLAAVRASAEIALGQERTPEEYRDRLADIVESCDSLVVLVNQLLLLAEGESGLIRTPRRVSLDYLASRIVDMFQGIAEIREVTLTAEIKDHVEIYGSDLHLRQVISNLVDNALKFTPALGSVRVLIERDGDCAHLEIHDSGCGISAEDLPHVFERFYRADRSRQREAGTGGFGLGLSICQALVYAHDGHILMESQPGKGTCVSVTLPLASAEVNLSKK